MVTMSNNNYNIARFQPRQAASLTAYGNSNRKSRVAVMLAPGDQQRPGGCVAFTCVFASTINRHLTPANFSFRLKDMAQFMLQSGGACTATAG